MSKIRTNVYIKTAVKEKLHDVQYIYRKRRNKNTNLSEIINTVFGNLSLEDTIKILDHTKPSKS